MLGRSGLLCILRQVVGDILVPATVYEECTHDTAKPGVLELAEARASGVLAVVLLAAKERRLIPEVASILADWRRWGYFLAPALLGERRFPLEIASHLCHGTAIAGG